MVKVVSFGIFVALMLSVTAEAAPMTGYASFTSKRVQKQDNQLETIHSKTQLHPQISFASPSLQRVEDKGLEYFNRDDANPVVHLFGLAVIPRNSSYIRLHNGSAAFPYEKLPAAANLYILNKMLSYRYRMKPGRLPNVHNLAIRMERTTVNFRL